MNNWRTIVFGPNKTNSSNYRGQSPTTLSISPRTCSIMANDGSYESPKQSRSGKQRCLINRRLQSTLKDWVGKVAIEGGKWTFSTVVTSSQLIKQIKTTVESHAVLWRVFVAIFWYPVHCRKTLVAQEKRTVFTQLRGHKMNDMRRDGRVAAICRLWLIVMLLSNCLKAGKN